MSLIPISSKYELSIFTFVALWIDVIVVCLVAVPKLCMFIFEVPLYVAAFPAPNILPVILNA